MLFKIVIVLILSFSVAIFVFSFIMTYYIINYDPFHKWADKLAKNHDSTEKIFILGSSQVQAINVTYVENILLNEGYNYVIYDLGVGGDLPSKRLGDIDRIISLHPSIIVYGVGFRDVERNKQSMSPLGTTTKSVTQNILPTPKILDEQTILSLQQNEFVNKILSSPKLISIKLFNYLIRGDFGYGYVDIGINPKWPLISPVTINVLLTVEEIEQKFENNPIVFRGIDNMENNKEFLALDKNIKKLKSHNIDVILYSVPYHRLLLNGISNSDKLLFTSTLEKIANENNATLYLLHEKYSDMPVWLDPFHLGYNKNTKIYTDDIAQFISDEIKS